MAATGMTGLINGIQAAKSLGICDPRRAKHMVSLVLKKKNLSEPDIISNSIHFLFILSYQNTSCYDNVLEQQSQCSYYSRTTYSQSVFITHSKGKSNGTDSQALMRDRNKHVKYTCRRDEKYNNRNVIKKN